MFFFLYLSFVFLDAVHVLGSGTKTKLQQSIALALGSSYLWLEACRTQRCAPLMKSLEPPKGNGKWWLVCMLQDETQHSVVFCLVCYSPYSPILTGSSHIMTPTSFLDDLKSLDQVPNPDSQIVWLWKLCWKHWNKGLVFAWGPGIWSEAGR